VAHETIAQIVQAGAELLVAGNAIYGSGDAEQNTRKLLAEAQAAAKV
jgi:ribulose-phosphate 3-epimerase